jgi:hypothetical protein
MAEKTTPPRGMVSAPSCGPEDVYAGHPIGLGFRPFSAQTARRDSSARCRVTATGNRCWKIRPQCHPIANGLPTRKPSETISSPLAQGNPAADRPSSEGVT